MLEPRFGTDAERGLEVAMQGVIGTRYHHRHRTASGARRRSVASVPRRSGDVLLIAVAVLLYFLVRGLVDGREAEAYRHAEQLIDLERSLGVFWEPTIQRWALDVGSIGTLANWVYIWGHWPVIIATFVWLLIAHRDVFPVYRNALLLSGAIGLVIFTTYPMAPPRFMEAWGFVDTVTLHSHSYRVLQPPSLVNQYAAMPSLHVGWDLLMGIAIARHAVGRMRWVGCVLPVMMFAAVVLTANHYLADGLVGGLVVLAALGVTLKVHGMSGRRVLGKSNEEHRRRVSTRQAAQGCS